MSNGPVSLDAVLAVLNQLVQSTNAQNALLKTVLPAVQSTATTATTGSSGALPSQVLKYLVVTDPTTGNSIKIPAYNL